MCEVTIIMFDNENELSSITEELVKLFPKDKTDKIFLGSYGIQFNRVECLNTIYSAVKNTIDKGVKKVYFGIFTKDASEIEQMLIDEKCNTHKISCREILRNL